MVGILRRRRDRFLKACTFRPQDPSSQTQQWRAGLLGSEALKVQQVSCIDPSLTNFLAVPQ
jgi:hypothetical protein